MKHDEAGGERSDFALLGKELEKLVQWQLDESRLNDAVSVEPTDEHQMENAEIDRTGESDQKSMAKMLHSRVHGDQQPRRDDSSEFSLEVEQKVERRNASRFPEIARLLLENRSLNGREVEPFGSIKTAVMTRLQEKWQLQWRKRWTSIQESEEEGLHVQVHECMMRGTLTAKLFNLFNQFLPTLF